MSANIKKNILFLQTLTKKRDLADNFYFLTTTFKSYKYMIF